MYLRNCWYVAAWSADVGRSLRAETFLGENILLYRQEDGTLSRWRTPARTASCRCRRATSRATTWNAATTG